MGKIFFTSDTHFGHVNIIPYCDRPFRHVDEMNREMMQRWNKVVGRDDTVYHLGDFSMRFKETAHVWGPKLNGRKVLVRGNHDKGPETMRKVGFDMVFDKILTVAGGEVLRLTHVPPNGADREGLKVPIPAEDEPGVTAFLCGHVHTQWGWKKTAAGVPVINVGVDQWDFTPVPLDEILKAIQAVREGALR